SPILLGGAKSANRARLLQLFIKSEGIMQGENSPPGQSRPLTAGTGSSSSYTSSIEPRESSPQILRQMA
ncbi:MAG TPA: hypothetical protein VH851_00525, partial [Candidatus Binatia bacterium]